MLPAYYSKEYDEKKIYDNLKITNDEYIASYEKHLNKHNVMYIDMNSIKDKYILYKFDKSLYIEDIVDFMQYMIIRDLKGNKEYTEQIGSDPLIGKKSLSSALEAVCRHTGEPLIFIMDEWDLIYMDYRNEDALQKNL